MPPLITHEAPDFLRTRLQVMLVEHRDLDDAIASLSTTAGQDVLRLQRLKKRKLLLKDRIAQLERLLEPDVPA